jgi:hypothetical protein
MIPQIQRGCLPMAMTNMTWSEYDAFQSDYEDMEGPDEYDTTEIHEGRARYQYHQYRLRGGQRRYYPSDLGTEDIYQSIEQPLQTDAPLGLWQEDYERLSPNCDRLLSWDYRDALRPWFETLDPQPTSVDTLAQAWHQEWQRKHGTHPSDHPPPCNVHSSPPSSSIPDTQMNSPVKGPFSDYASPKPLQLPSLHWSQRKSSPGQPGLDEPGHPLYAPAPPKTPSPIHHRCTQTKRIRLADKGTSPSSPSSHRQTPPRPNNRYSPLADDDDDAALASAPTPSHTLPCPPAINGPEYPPTDSTHQRQSTDINEDCAHQGSS